LGGVGGYYAARLYLCWLMKIAAGGKGEGAILLFYNFAGLLCGVICTTFIHGVLVTISIIAHGFSGVFFSMIIFAEVIGAMAGVVVGGICNRAYLRSVAGENDGGSCE